MTPPPLAPLPPGVGSRPRVSIVMPTYRRAALIGESIGSLLRQGFADFELIVQDDASPDGTERVVAAIGDPRIRYHRNPANLGMPGNLNAGIRRTRGAYVLVCHDHDLYAPDLVGAMAAVLDEVPDLAYVHAGVRVIDQAGRPRRTYVGAYARVTPGRAWAALMLSRFDSPVCANSMVARRRYEAVGLYDERFGFVADVEMWIRLALHGDVGYIARPLIDVREREPGHVYFERRWEILESLVQILRFHRAEVHRARWRALQLQARVEAHLVRTLLSTLRHGGRAELRRARACLRRSPSLLCRALAVVAA
jgi:glycosyltransferase involved in cell wall biosynthesis